MRDIVKKLRDGLTREEAARTQIVPRLWVEAADEIERLRAKLAKAEAENARIREALVPFAAFPPGAISAARVALAAGDD